MKNLPLAVQIWLLCVIITLSVSGLIVLFLPGMLQQFFTQQVLGILEDAQKSIKVATVTVQDISSVETTQGLIIMTEAQPVSNFVANGPETDSVAISLSAAPSSADELPVIGKVETISIGEGILTDALMPFMNHIYFSKTVPLPEQLLPEPFQKQIEQEADHQQEIVKEYTAVNNGRTLLYVIRKTTVDGNKGILLSYAWGTYRNDMVGSLYRKLLLLILAAIALSWIPALFVSRHLTRPLVKIERHVDKIGSKEWYEPLDLGRKDEIGKLAYAFENMRERLIRQDQAQQAYLQNISHSLKTPIMVIQSYSKAILDGIYPKGDLNNSLLTVKNEADRTNKLVQDLLMLNKIKYLSTRDIKRESIEMAPLIEEIAEKFSSRRPELHWKIELADYNIVGDPDQWKVVLENLLDNATRYASGAIEILLQNNLETEWWLRIWNDGMAVDSQSKEKIFEEYYTGKGGQSGLGLAIVRHIVELHQCRVWVENQNNGVSFYIM